MTASELERLNRRLVRIGLRPLKETADQRLQREALEEAVRRTVVVRYGKILRVR